MKYFNIKSLFFTTTIISLLFGTFQIIKPANPQVEGAPSTIESNSIELTPVLVSIFSGILATGLGVVGWVDKRLDLLEKQNTAFLGEISLLNKEISFIKKTLLEKEGMHEKDIKSIKDNVSAIEISLKQIILFNNKLGFVERTII